LAQLTTLEHQICRWTEVQPTPLPLRLLAAILLWLAVTPAVAGAQSDDQSANGAALAAEALGAVAFDPWLLQDDEIDPRRADVVAYEVYTNVAAAKTAAAVAETEAELLVA